MKKVVCFLYLYLFFVASNVFCTSIGNVEPVGEGFRLSFPNSEPLNTSEIAILLDDPVALNDQGMKLRVENLSNIHGESAEELYEQLIELENKMSLTWFTECNDVFCPLTRRKNSNNNWRDLFEQAVVESLGETLAAKEQGIDLAFLGSGGLLAEARMVLLLIQAGVKIKSISLTEHKYDFFSQHLGDRFRGELEASGFNDLENLPENVGKNQVITFLLQRLLAAKLFKRTINAMQEDSFELNIFSSAEKFSQAIVNEQIPRMDLIFTLDPLDGNSDVENFLRDLDTLLKTPLGVGGFFANLLGNYESVGAKMVMKTNEISENNFMNENFTDYFETIFESSSQSKRNATKDYSQEYRRLSKKCLSYLPFAVLGGGLIVYYYFFS